MSKQKCNYDFSETAAFLEHSVSLEELCSDIQEAKRALSLPTKRIDRNALQIAWLVLVECADFLDTIECTD